jgi:hypothetical protein
MRIPDHGAAAICPLRRRMAMRILQEFGAADAKFAMVGCCGTGFGDCRRTIGAVTFHHLLFVVCCPLRPARDVASFPLGSYRRRRVTVRRVAERA